jgi:hypothetical protein
VGVVKAVLVLCCVAAVLVLHLGKTRGLGLFTAAFAAVCRAFSPVTNAGRRVLVMVGAAEMLAVSAVAQWWRAQRAKLHVKYKYVRRIWRRTGGDVGPFLWQLLHGIESSQASGGAASGGQSGKKSASKRGGKQSAGKSSGRTSNSSNSAVRLQDTAAAYSSVSRAFSTDASYASSSSSSSIDQEEDDESLADLLTLSPAAPLKCCASTKQARGKHSTAKVAAAVKAGQAAKQPSAAASSNWNLGGKAVATAKATTTADTSRGKLSLGEYCRCQSCHLDGSSLERNLGKKLN